MLLRFDTALPLNEKRPKVSFPVIPNDAKTLREFKQRFDSYFRDNVGFRDRIVRMHHRLKATVFGTSPHPQMLIGRDGWLFVNPSHYMNYYRGVSLMDQKEQANYRDCINRRNEVVCRKGGIYRIVIAPNKETIYPEYLPKKFHRLINKSRTDQLLTFVNNSASKKLLDLRPALKSAKLSYPVYFKTDTHWNSAGALYAYVEIMSSLKSRLVGLNEINSAGTTLELGNPSSPGDLAIAMGLDSSVEENAVIMHGPTPKAKLVAVPEAYLKYQRQTHRKVEIYENASVRGFRLVMFHDSFGELLRPLLAEHFERSVFINRPDMSAFFSDVIETERPTVVLDEIAEEHLMNPPPNPITDVGGQN